MGCGTCPKKQLKLNSSPQGLPIALVDEMRDYVGHRVQVKDRLGIITLGECLDVWVDDSETGEFVEIGNVAIKTYAGTSLIGMNIIESIELKDSIGNPQAVN